MSEEDLKIGRTEERETGNLVIDGLRQKGNQKGLVAERLYGKLQQGKFQEVAKTAHLLLDTENHMSRLT